MDHDAMLTDVRNLKKFRDEFFRQLVLAGAMPEATLEAFSALSARVEGGQQRMIAEQPVRTGSAPDPALTADEVSGLKAGMAQLPALMELGARLEAVLPKLEKLIEDVEDMKMHQTELADHVTALQRADAAAGKPDGAVLDAGGPTAQASGPGAGAAS